MKGLAVWSCRLYVFLLLLDHRIFFVTLDAILLLECHARSPATFLGPNPTSPSFQHHSEWRVSLVPGFWRTSRGRWVLASQRQQEGHHNP